MLAYGMVLKAVSTATYALLLLLKFLGRESLYQGRILRASSSRAAAFGCWTGVFARKIRHRANLSQYLLQMMLIHESFLDVIAANLVTVILDSGDCCLHLALLLVCLRVVRDGGFFENDAHVDLTGSTVLFRSRGCILV